MHSFLIISSDNNNSESFVLDFLKKENIDPFDIETITADDSIGIGEVRNIQKKIYLKPLRSLKKAVYIKDSEKLTTEAQNALLKILEEPPINTLILLSANLEDSLLPTVLSRCKIILLDSLNMMNEKEDEKFIKLVTEIDTMDIGQRLKLAQDISKDKTSASEFLKKILSAARKKMLDDYSWTDNSKKIIETYRLLTTTNIQIRLLMENLFLDL